MSFCIFSEGEEGEEDDDDEGESKIPMIEYGLPELKALQNALEKEKEEDGVSRESNRHTMFSLTFWYL